MELAVAAGKTIVFAGATGSGKTTYMKSLIDFIPLNTRLITIEDAEEIKFFIHKNYVHLFYPSESGSDSGSIITAAKLIKSCLRMKPDRILLAEIKGGDAWDFVKVAGSGHRKHDVHSRGLGKRCHHSDGDKMLSEQRMSESSF